MLNISHPPPNIEKDILAIGVFFVIFSTRKTRNGAIWPLCVTFLVSESPRNYWGAFEHLKGHKINLDRVSVFLFHPLTFWGLRRRPGEVSLCSQQPWGEAPPKVWNEPNVDLQEPSLLPDFKRYF